MVTSRSGFRLTCLLKLQWRNTKSHTAQGSQDLTMATTTLEIIRRIQEALDQADWTSVTASSGSNSLFLGLPTGLFVTTV